MVFESAGEVPEMNCRMLVELPEPFTRSARGGRLGVLFLCLAMAAVAVPAFGQQGGAGLGAQAVGGIAIDADGIIRNLDPRALEGLAEKRRQALAGKPLGAAGQRDLQKVSLRRIIAAVEEAMAEGTQVPTDVLTLGGLEQIDYVFVDPDARDLILAGPGDAAVIDAAGNLVAATSGRPLLLLEDLIVSLRAIDAARMGGMRCSIDPTPEGIAQLQALLSGVRSLDNPQAVFRRMEEALGPQQVTVGGVPADSHFAQVLVAADYRMKRIGMGLEESGLRSLPSYLSMVPGTAGAAMLPRFWLEARYDPIARDPDELTWKLGDRKLVCLTESDLLAREGLQRGRGRQNVMAKRWCELMTTHYDELATRQPVFAELANCVDLAVVAALIDSRQLADRAGLDLSPLVNEAGLALPVYAVPRQVPTVAHGIKRGKKWVLSASGGVQFQPWAFIDTPVEAADLGQQRTLALASRPETSFCWE